MKKLSLKKERKCLAGLNRESKEQPGDKSYYESEINKLLPLDEYGVHIKLTSTQGNTKSLLLNKVSFNVIKSLLKDVIK